MFEEGETLLSKKSITVNVDGLEKVVFTLCEDTPEDGIDREICSFLVGFAKEQESAKRSIKIDFELDSNGMIRLHSASDVTEA